MATDDKTDSDWNIENYQRATQPESQEVKAEQYALANSHLKEVAKRPENKEQPIREHIELVSKLN